MISTLNPPALYRARAVFMADLLDRGLSWLSGKRHANMTREISYRRGSDRITISATAARSRFDQQDNAGAVIESETADWIIRSADLVFGGRQVEPDRGDEIRCEDEAGTVQVYQILPDGTLPPFSYTDRSRRSMRVRTKFLKTEGCGS